MHVWPFNKEITKREDDANIAISALHLFVYYEFTPLGQDSRLTSQSELEI